MSEIWHHHHPAQPPSHPHPNFNVEFHIHLKHTMDQWFTYIWNGAESYRCDLNIDLWGVRREVEGKGHMSTLILGSVATLRPHKSVWFYCPCTVPRACSTLCIISFMIHGPELLIFTNPFHHNPISSTIATPSLTPDGSVAFPSPAIVAKPPMLPNLPQWTLWCAMPLMPAQL